MVGTTTRAQMLAAFALILATGCATSEKEIRRARMSGYQAEFATVYNQALIAVRELYPELIEDPRKGVIKTAWHVLRIRQDSSEISPTVTGDRTGGGPGTRTPGQNAFGNSAYRRKLYFVRFQIHVVGGDPWRIKVKGEASSWRVSEEIPVPLTGAARPPWLDGRIDALQVAIHKRLKKYAVPLKYEMEEEEPEAEAVAEVDESLYGEVPEAAAKVIGAVHRAALARDPAGLRQHMAEEFIWASGGESPSADVAVAMWQADDSLLSSMAEVLSQGCKVDDAEITVTCPPAYTGDPSYRGYRAGFQRAGDAWQMTFFYSEE